MRCAGCFTATTTMPLLAQVFESADALDRLEAFTSTYGASFYQLAKNTGVLTLERSDAPVTFPDKIATAQGPVTVFNPGFPVHWRVAG